MSGEATFKGSRTASGGAARAVAGGADYPTPATINCGAAAIREPAELASPKAYQGGGSIPPRPTIKFWLFWIPLIAITFPVWFPAFVFGAWCAAADAEDRQEFCP